MIEYIIPENPDDRVFDRASALLNNGSVIAIPTDTNWLAVASIKSPKGVDKLYKIKSEGQSKHFSILVNDFSLAQNYAHISNSAFRPLKKIIPGHYTFIFAATRNAQKLLNASKRDGEIGVRFVPVEWVRLFLERHKEALVSTNITAKMLGLADGESIYSYLIEEKYSNFIDLIIDPGEYEFVGKSSIVDFTGEAVEIIREGAGDCSMFK
ncbi:MAG: L-threonylcarbamoyladenylate synthase [Halobacteriovoraceae bacterium]|nr:L-threonylcarbamoyladenylate synthase [Halobacteriovoraceae bacterium]